MRLPLKICFPVLLISVGFFSACTPGNSPDMSPAPTLPPVTPLPTLEAPTAAPSPIPTVLPTLTPTTLPTQPVVQVCPVTGKLEPLTSTDYAGLPHAITVFLNEGGSREHLESALADAGLANQPRSSASGDLNGDGWLDISVSIFNPASTRIPPEGALLVFLCQGNQYQLAENYPSSDNQGSPRILFQQDLDADGQDELVTAQGTCGASTCFDEVQILKWNGTVLENRLQGSTLDLPYPEVSLKEDASGVDDLVIQGGEVGSVGAGVQRTALRIAKYQSGSQTWVFAPDILQPSNYRIHVLQDADTALQNGQIDAALAGYERVYWDTPPLQDYIDPLTEQANLAGYAGYKIVALQAKAGQSQKSQDALALLVGRFAPTTPQYLYAQLAQAYLDALSQGGQDAACQEAMGFAALHTETILDPLGPQAFGYANRAFTPQDVCP